MESHFLIGKPSFLSGASRTLDLRGVFDDYNYSLTPEQADQIALFLDWYMTGQDLQSAIKVHDKSNKATRETSPTTASR